MRGVAHVLSTVQLLCWFYRYCEVNGQLSSQKLPPNKRNIYTKHSRSEKQPEQMIFDLRKKGSKTTKRMKEEEIEKGDCGLPTRKVNFF